MTSAKREARDVDESPLTYNVPNFSGFFRFTCSRLSLVCLREVSCLAVLWYHKHAREYLYEYTGSLKKLHESFSGKALIIQLC